MAETTRSPTTSTYSASGDASAIAERALSEAKGIGTELMAAVSDSANALYEEQRNRAADEITAVGEVLRRSVQSLDQPGGAVARCGDEAVRQLNDFAVRLRSRSWGELTTDVEDSARHYPLAFIGMATGLGFIAGRFLTASATQLVQQPATTSPGWQTGPGSGGRTTQQTGVTSAVSSASGFGSGAGGGGNG